MLLMAMVAVNVVARYYLNGEEIKRMCKNHRGPWAGGLYCKRTCIIWGCCEGVVVNG